MENKLSIEEQFIIARFNAQTEYLSREQAIDMLKQVHQLWIVTKSVYLTELLSHLPQNEHNQRPTTEESRASAADN